MSIKESLKLLFEDALLDKNDPKRFVLAGKSEHFWLAMDDEEQEIVNKVAELLNVVENISGQIEDVKNVIR